MAEHQFQLVVRKGPKMGQIFPLDNASLIIGRDPMSDILLNDPEVSRQHVRLTRSAQGYLLEDLGSTNGTYVDGQRLSSEARALQPGQSVSIGSGVRLVYERVGTAGAGEDTLVDTASPVATAGGANASWEEEPEYEAAADAFAEPAPYAYTYQPEPEAPLVPSAAGEGRSRRNSIIALVIILMLCCCCAFVGFMYQWGGDMLFEYLGLY